MRSEPASTRSERTGPWSWFVPIVAVSALRRQTEGGGPGQRLAWVWLLAPLVFFSLSDSKRSGIGDSSTLRP